MLYFVIEYTTQSTETESNDITMQRSLKQTDSKFTTHPSIRIQFVCKTYPSTNIIIVALD